VKEPLHELTLGRSHPSHDHPKVRTGPDAPADESQAEPESLAARCRGKAEAARWAAERQRRIHERDEAPDRDAPTDPAMKKWAEALSDVFYWASADDPADTPDVSPLDQVGGCFEALAEALLLAGDAQGRRGGPERALPLLAEAQSAVRRSLRRLKVPDDPDQLAAYQWVRDTAARHHVFLRRFLRADDLADPAGWPGLLARIEAQAGGGPRSERQAELLDDLRSLCAMDEGERTEASSQAIVTAVAELVGEGTPPSSREVRELLLPLLDELPEVGDLPPGLRLVLREIDRYLATRPSPTTRVAPQEPTGSVLEAARLLSGRSAVLISGLRRPEAQRSLKTALGLKELVWVETREHESVTAFEPVIARPDVAVVLLAIRWSSHSFGDVRRFCDRHGKSLVRLPGGYNPNQVAAQILAQCGGQLGSAGGP
jgi:hypothetical protein